MTNRSIYIGAIIVLYMLAVACRKDSSTEIEKKYTGNITFAFSHDDYRWAENGDRFRCGRCID